MKQIEKPVGDVAYEVAAQYARILVSLSRKRMERTNPAGRWAVWRECIRISWIRSSFTVRIRKVALMAHGAVKKN